MIEIAEFVCFVLKRYMFLPKYVFFGGTIIVQFLLLKHVKS